MIDICTLTTASIMTITAQACFTPDQRCSISLDGTKQFCPGYEQVQCPQPPKQAAYTCKRPDGSEYTWGGAAGD